MTNVWLLLLGICLAVSFVCAGMEAGVLALSRWRIRQQARAGRRRARMLQSFLDQPETFLWTIVVANTVAALAVFALVAAGLFRLARGHPALSLAAFVAAVVLFYAVCDLFPKLLFRMYPNFLCMAAVLPFQGLHLLLAPVVRPVQGFTNLFLRWTGGKAYTGQLFNSRKELGLAMQDSAESLSSEEQAMIRRVLELPQLQVGKIAVPMAQLPMLTAGQGGGALIQAGREAGRNFLPVWEEGPGRRVAGVIDYKALLYASEAEQLQPVRPRVVSALFLPEKTGAEEALRRMQKAGQTLAIVLDADRREIGVVWMEEIFRVIFGEVKV